MLNMKDPLILEIQKILKEDGIEVDYEDIILTKNAVAIQKDNVIQIIKTNTIKKEEKQEVQIIYGI